MTINVSVSGRKRPKNFRYYTGTHLKGQKNNENPAKIVGSLAEIRSRYPPL
jgi:hypothetical protein